MKSKIGWILGIILIVILVVAVPAVWILSRFAFGGYRGMMRFPGMMGGYGYMHPFGGIGMLFGWVVPVGIFLLIVLGAVALGRSLNRPANVTQPPVMPAAPARTCSHCGKPAQADWTTCPYCSEKLT